MVLDLTLPDASGLDILREIRQAAYSGIRSRIGAGLFRPALRPLRDKIDPEFYGGAYLVGLRGLSVIAHGSSSRVAIRRRGAQTP